MNRFPRLRAGFTLVEMVISMSILALAGGGIYTFICTWNDLYVRNFALNDTEITARKALDRVTHEMEGAAGSAALLDQAGNVVASNNALQGGVAIGTVGLGVRFNQQTSSNTARTVAFWVVQTDAELNRNEMRYYSNGFSSTSKNYVVLVRNLLAPKDMNDASDNNKVFDYPFAYFRFNDTQRCLSLNLRARSSQYDRYIASIGRKADTTAFEEFNTFFQVRSVVAYRCPPLTGTVITNNNGAAN